MNSKIMIIALINLAIVITLYFTIGITSCLIYLLGTLVGTFFGAFQSETKSGGGE